MGKTIFLADLLGVDIRSRIRVGVLREALRGGDGSPVDVDFSGISFITRSVADELINVQNEYSSLGGVNFVSLNDGPRTMLDVVRKGRASKRVRDEEPYNIVVLHDMKSVSEYFSNL